MAGFEVSINGRICVSTEAGYMEEKRNSPDGYRPFRNGEMPDIILVSRDFIPEGYRWLWVEYAELNAPAFNRQNIRVWRRLGEIKAQ